jgi:hypothetical protein
VQRPIWPPHLRRENCGAVWRLRRQTKQPPKRWEDGDSLAPPERAAVTRSPSAGADEEQGLASERIRPVRATHHARPTSRRRQAGPWMMRCTGDVAPGGSAPSTPTPGPWRSEGAPGGPKGSGGISHAPSSPLHLPHREVRNPVTLVDLPRGILRVHPAGIKLVRSRSKRTLCVRSQRRRGGVRRICLYLGEKQADRGLPGGGGFWR